MCARASSCIEMTWYLVEIRFLLPGKVVESKRNPLIFRFLVVTSTPVPDKVAESYEIADNDDDTSDFDDTDDVDDDDARTRIMRG